MKTGKDGIYLMHKYESCRLEAYLCPAKKWTIGWGDTGPGVVKGLKITQAEADQRFANRLDREFEPGVNRAISGLTQREFDALVSFSYNLGVQALTDSTLLRMLKAGDRKGAADQFLRWDKESGKRSLGLYRRRVSERALFLGSDAGFAYTLGQDVRVLP